MFESQLLLLADPKHQTIGLKQQEYAWGNKNNPININLPCMGHQKLAKKDYSRVHKNIYRESLEKCPHREFIIKQNRLTSSIHRVMCRLTTTRMLKEIKTKRLLRIADSIYIFRILFQCRTPVILKT